MSRVHEPVRGEAEAHGLIVVMHEIVYVSGDGWHWYGCAVIRRRAAYPAWRHVNVDEITCGTCRPLMGSPSWD